MRPDEAGEELGHFGEWSRIDATRKAAGPGVVEPAALHGTALAPLVRFDTQPEQPWRDLLEPPLLVLMIGSTLRVCVNKELAAARPIAPVSPGDAIVESAQEIHRVTAGLLP